MKQILLIVVVFVALYACNTQKSLNVKKSDDTAVEDSTEYEVETFDGQFESWYDYHNRPSTYKSKEYYESWNLQYVTAWNAKCASSGRSWHFEPVVGYEPGEDYGFELNHKLFYYFMYVENVLGITIVPAGPRFSEI